MPTVADLQSLVAELDATAARTAANAHVTGLIEAADRCQIRGYARWTSGRLDVWNEYGPTIYGRSGHYDTSGDNTFCAFTVPAVIPETVIELLQIAAAECVDKAAGILDSAPKQPTSSQDLAIAAKAATSAKERVEEAVVLEAVAGACTSGVATIHLSSRRGSSGPRVKRTAAVCILTPSGHHVCVQPEHGGYMSGHGGYDRWMCRYSGPSCEHNTSCSPTICLHAPGCRCSGYERWHNCPTVHPIVAELSAVVASVLRTHHGLLLPERTPLLHGSATRP